MPMVNGGPMNRISQQRARARQWRMLLQPDESATLQSVYPEPTQIPKTKKATR
jgi:hypothetical protein